MAYWSSLSTSSTPTTTGAEWDKLRASLDDAHTNNFVLYIRVRAGVLSAPQWMYTHPTLPVPWMDVSSAAAAAPKVGIAPTGTQPAVPLPWNSGVVASPTSAQIQAAVAASNYRAHYTATFLNPMVSLLAEPCGIDPTHARVNHMFGVQCAGPCMYDPEMTTSDQAVGSFGSTFGRTAVGANTGPITGDANCIIAYEWAWKLMVDDHLAILPTALQQQAHIMTGFLFGSSAAQRDLLDTYGPGWGKKVGWGRTDFRQGYWTSFGKEGFATAVANPNSPLNVMKRAAALSLPVGIQTAGDGLLFDLGGPTNTQTFITMTERLFSEIPSMQFYETSNSLDAVAHGSGFFNGQQFSTVSTLGSGANPLAPWPGGTVNAAEYLDNATGNLQGRMVGLKL